MVYGFIFSDFLLPQIVGLVIIITGIIDCFINLGVVQPVKNEFTSRDRIVYH